MTYKNIYFRGWWRPQVLASGDPAYVAHVALYNDDGAIGNATLRDTRSIVGLDVQYSYDYTPSGNRIDVVYTSINYPQQPIHFRIRLMMGYSDHFLPTGIADTWDFRDWYAYAVIPRQFEITHWGSPPPHVAAKIYSCDQLEPYDSEDGTTSSTPQFSYSSSEVFRRAEMARYTSSDWFYVGDYGSQGTYADWGQLPHRKIHDPVFYGSDAALLGASGLQFPHHVSDADQNYTSWRWEIEFEITDESPIYDANENKWITHVYTNVGYMGSFNGSMRGGKSGYGIWFVFKHNNSGTGEPTPISPVRAIHNLSGNTLLVSDNTRLQRRSLFSFAALNTARNYASGSNIIRIRELPRYRASLVLLRTGSSSPYTFAVHVEDANGTQEVTSMTGVNALIEVAPTKREALLILQDSSNAIWAYKSQNGGWTWGSAQRCQIAGSNMSASQLHDLDFSIRRGVYLMTATVSGSIKLLISEDGVNWTDTGV